MSAVILDQSAAPIWHYGPRHDRASVRARKEIRLEGTSPGMSIGGGTDHDD